jgi:hypothetical protein
VHSSQDIERELRPEYWHICELTALKVESAQKFSGSIRVKAELGGSEYPFDEGTLPYTVAVP